MPVIEHVIRYRCATCMLAVELMNAVNVPALPAKIEQMTITLGLPTGWTYSLEDGLMRCPAHEIGRIKPVVALPLALRGR